MEIHGMLTQAGGVSSVDETLLFATKTTNGKNFYLALAGQIAAGASVGYYMPYEALLTNIIASLTTVAAKDVVFSIKDGTTNSELHTFTILKGAMTYFEETKIEIPKDSNLVIQCLSVGYVVNPIVRLIVGKKSNRSSK